MRLTAKPRRSLALPATAGLTALLIAAFAAPASADTSNVRATAFQANTGHLFIYQPSNNSHTDTGLGMAGGTSPSYAGTPQRHRGSVPRQQRPPVVLHSDERRQPRHRSRHGRRNQPLHLAPVPRL
jgi:hypothetical protein